jgi:predicted branched-subunit amino acid permease
MMKIYFLGMIVSFIITLILFLVSVREAKKKKRVYLLTLRELLQGFIIITSSWAFIVAMIITVILKKDANEIILRKF